MLLKNKANKTEYENDSVSVIPIHTYERQKDKSHNIKIIFALMHMSNSSW